MLDVHEDGLAIRCFSQAGDFAALGAHQKALERALRGGLAHGRDDVQLAAIGLGVAQRLLAAVAHLAGHGGQHHAVGNIGVGAIIGLNPADAGGLAEHQTVRAGEVLVSGQCGDVDQRLVGTGFGAKQVHVPAEAGDRSTFLQAHQVAVGVAVLLAGALHVGVGTGVGCIGQVLAAGGVDAAVAVVGQREVDLAVGGVHGVPLGAVHLGGTHGICSQAGVDGDVSGIGKLVGGVACNGGIGHCQLHPGAGAVGVELGCVELAAVQVLVAHGHAVGGVGIGCAPHGGGHKLVDVFAARIITHVNAQRLADHGLAKGSAFVCKAAQRGALFGHAGLVIGVDLDDVAHAVHLVAVVVAAVGRRTGLAVVPALVLVVGTTGFPAVARCGALAAAVALERGHALVVAACGVVGSAAREIAKPVFFAGQERAPGRLARAAVVQRAAGHGAGGRILGDELRVATGGACNLDRAQGGEAEVLRRARHISPFAGALGHFDHGNAVDGGFLVHFRRGAGQRGGAAVGVQEERGQLLVGGGFVVDGQQTALGGAVVAFAVGTQTKPFHTVVVVTSTLVEIAVGTVILVGSHTSGHRVAQRKQNAGGVASRHDHCVGKALGHCAEAQHLGFCNGIIAAAAGGDAQAAQHGGAHRANAATQQATARQTCTQHGIECGVGRGVGIFVIEVNRLLGRIHAVVHRGSLGCGLQNHWSVRTLCDTTVTFSWHFDGAPPTPMNAAPENRRPFHSATGRALAAMRMQMHAVVHAGEDQGKRDA